MLKSRRGLLAAGLAVAVVGAIGAASTLNAGAEQIPGDQDATQATVAAAADTSDDATPQPPATLPWGGKPVRAHRGWTGMSSRALADQGLQAAGDNKPHRDFAPKGLSQQAVQPPAPAPSVSASSTTVPVTAGPTTTAPAPAGATTTTAPTPSSTTAAPPVQATTPPANTAQLNSATNTSTVVPNSAAAASPSTDTSAKFLYAVGSQATTADGMYAGLDIAQPVLKQGDYHTLAELSVQDSPKPNNVIEVGWNVDRAVNGDDNVHLFVYYWINGKGVCYNLCDGNFVPYNDGINAGDTLPVGKFKKFGIQYNDGAWWIAYDTTFVGYYPAKLWTDQNAKFTFGSYFQAFGEVAAATWTPCTQMGNGVIPVDNTSASTRIATITYVNGPLIPTMDVRTQAIDADGKNQWTPDDKYNIIAATPKTFRYGGPGCS